MKYYISIVSLLLTLLCVALHADENRVLNMLELRWDDTNRLGYELFLMGDKAIPYLIENLTNDDHRIRENAIQAIYEYYPEPSVMSALTVVFIHNEDNMIRDKAAQNMANIDAKFANVFAKVLMVEHLDVKDPETQRIAIDVLIKLKDERVIPYLVEQINDPKTAPERRRELLFGLADFKDKRAIPDTVVFIHNEDNMIRNKAAHNMANIDAEFAKVLMAKHLDADPETQRIAIDVLIKLKDERVIPYLVEQINDPKTAPERRRELLFGLADFKDKRAIPELLKILSQPSTNAIEVLGETIQQTAQIDDPRTVSILLDAMDPYSNLGRRVSSRITTAGINSMSEFGLSSIQKMLDTVKVTEAIDVEQRIHRVLRKVKNEEVIPIFEKECIETENEKLKSALVHALTNMGQEGFVALVNVAKQNPSTSVLTALSTFNNAEAIEVVGTIALNPSSQLRLQAVETLTKFGTFWNAEIQNYIPQLLGDNNPNVRISAINTIRKMKLTEMIPKLEQLAKESKGNTRNAAYVTIDELSEKNPLDLKIEMVSKKYDYGHPIALKYTIRNIGEYPVKIGFRRDVESGYLKLEIQQPDGTMAKVFGQRNRLRTSMTNEYYHTIVKDGDDEVILLPVNPNSFNILQPDEVFTDIIPVSKNYHLFQTGNYSVQLKIFLSPWKPIPAPKRTSEDKIPPLGSQVKSNLMAWEQPLVSPKASFEIKAPTPMQFNSLLKMLDPNHINNYDIKQLEHVCFQLGELRKPDAIKPLKMLSSSQIYIRSSSRSRLGVSAHRALLNYPDTDMTQEWLQILDRENIYNEVISDAIYKLRTTRDKQNIKPLLTTFLQSRNKGLSIELALILNQLGDDSCLQWLKSVANRKLRSYDKKTRISAAILLSQLKQPFAKEIRLPLSIMDDLPIVEIHKNFHLLEPIWHTSNIENVRLGNPWFYAEYFDTNFNITEIQKKAETVDGLKELLAHNNPHIQRAAAYDLASLGDKSGVHLIEKDFHANDNATRIHARQILVKLQSE